MTDIPRAELMALADKAIRDAGGPEVAFVHFKFTCVICGERCVMREPNTLWERGECASCGYDQPVPAGGFLLVMRLDPPKPKGPLN